MYFTKRGSPLAYNPSVLTLLKFVPPTSTLARLGKGQLLRGNLVQKESCFSPSCFVIKGGRSQTTNIILK